MPRLSLAPSFALAALVFSVALPSSASAQSSSIDVCCAWDEALADGVLTYMISGGDDSIQSVLVAAAEAWDAALSDLALTRVSGKTRADINIRYKSGGGRVQGVAVGKGRGFISSCDLQVSGKVFGTPNGPETLGEIARHELGHCLGLGHANFDDLMDPTVGGQADISRCDVEAVRQANHWYFIDQADTPHAPHVRVWTC